MDELCRQEINDPILHNLLLEHVKPWVISRFSGFKFATVQSVTTAKCTTNRYVLKIRVNGIKDVRLVIGVDGSIRNSFAGVKY